MNIELWNVPVRDIVSGYKNNDVEGVYCYGENVNVRPPYQREFIYNLEESQAVINTILNGFPLNTMYWVRNKHDDYEVMDGQQRTISICEFVTHGFSIQIDKKPYYFDKLSPEEQEKILNYELMVYICEGTEREKLAWFRIVNIAGKVLTEQELRNAIYAGPWISDARRWFSKPSGAAVGVGKDYLKGQAIRQEYLETVLKWIAASENKKIDDYMAEHQDDENASALWQYFQSVIGWVKVLFPTYRREMKGLEWGLLYNKYKNNSYNSMELEKKIQELINDDDVQSVSGIYLYLFDKQEKHLNLRAFDKKLKRKVYEKQNGICPYCKNHFAFEEMEADHIIPWSQGGHTDEDNCQMLCQKCNNDKRDK